MTSYHFRTQVSWHKDNHFHVDDWFVETDLGQLEAWNLVTPLLDEKYGQGAYTILNGPICLGIGPGAAAEVKEFEACYFLSDDDRFYVPVQAKDIAQAYDIARWKRPLGGWHLSVVEVKKGERSRDDRAELKFVGTDDTPTHS
jgi:hypothetical protein